MNIAVISGSARPQRQSHHVAKAIEQRLKNNASLNISILDVLEEPLPLLDWVYREHPSPSAILRHWHETIDNADAFIAVTPEHNGSYSGAIKNAMDYFFPEYFDKPMAIVTASSGMLGGVKAATHFQNYALILKAIVMADFLITPKVQTLFDANGNLTDEGFSQRLDKFLDKFLQFCNTHRKALED